MDEVVWLWHPPTGGKAAFNPIAAELWKARGWEPYPPPAKAVPEPEPASRRQTKEQ